MYNYKSLNEISWDEITNCLNLAFSDYYLPIQFTQERMQAYFEINGVDKELSFAAFLEDQMVGFIINSCSCYNNQKAVFDVATGVIPEHRGNKVFTNLYKFTEQKLQMNQVEKYYLEVLQQNHKAIGTYKKQGFTVIREFSVLKVTDSDSIPKTMNSNVEYIDYDNFDFNKTGHCIQVPPSYEHSVSVVKRNPRLYTVVYREKKDEITAFCVIAKENGHIIQLGYSDICELKIIVQSLMSKFSGIVAKNIDMSYPEVLEMFCSAGFTEVAKQFEMVKDLCVNALVKE